MFRTFFISGVLCLFFFGCAAKEPQQDKTATGNAMETVKTEKEQVTEKQVEKEEKDPCADLLEKAVLESRKTMKTVKESCQGLSIEVNPMWDIKYDGTVHIRIYDAAGEKIRDEFQKPSDPQNPARYNWHW